jgi:transposase
MNSKDILGIDIAKEKFDVALIINDQQKHKVFGNNEKGFSDLKKWLDKYEAKNIHACMESTGIYGKALALNLYNQKHTVSIVNPVKIKAFGKSKLTRNKTDKADAKIIAEFCVQMKPQAWEPKPAHIEELGALTKRLADLTNMVGQEKNRLESSPKSTSELIELTIKHLKDQIEVIKKKIKEHIENHEDLRQKRDLLATIPGVGEATIAQMLTFLDCPEKFESAKKVAAYLGLTPRHFESGSTVHGKTRLSKIGDAELRKSLYFPAITAIRYNPIIKAFYDHLLRAGKCKMVAICAAMRKLVHIIYGVLKSNRPFDANIAN